jgi:hypothetical protein
MATSKLAAAVRVLREAADKTEGHIQWSPIVWPDAETFHRHVANLEDRARRADTPPLAREVLKAVTATGRGLAATLEASPTLADNGRR